LWLTILLAHQSEPDRLMMLRVLDYLVQIWKAQVRAWGQEQGSLASVKLRPILPVVFYTGSCRWENLGRLVDLMDEGAAVERHTPAFEPLFVNLPDLAAERLRKESGSFGQVLQVVQQRGARRSQFRETLGHAVAALETMAANDRLRRLELLSYLTALVYHDRAPAEREEMVEVVEKSARKAESPGGGYGATDDCG
jgi:hypothetical protein